MLAIFDPSFPVITYSRLSDCFSSIFMRFDNGSTPARAIGNVITPILLCVTIITSDEI